MGLYPFIINGQYWRHVGVDVRQIQLGEVVVPVQERMDLHQDVRMEDCRMLRMERVIFRLARMGSVAPPLRADWVDCFWAVDPRVEIDQQSGRIYLT